MNSEATEKLIAVPEGGVDHLWRKRLAIEAQLVRRYERVARHHWHPRHLLRTDVFIRTALWLCGVWGRGTRNAQEPRIVTHEFRFEHLPEAFDGFRILHLSDTHFEGQMPYTEKTVRMLRNVEADLCVLTGDYRFQRLGPYEHVFEQMEHLLTGINTRYGAVGILGNHDRGVFVERFEAMGIRMLLNQHVELNHDGDRVWIVGVDDRHRYRCDDMAAASALVPPDGFKILLAHSPEIIDEAAERGMDLYLCGHTHGGQICFPIVGPVILNARAPRRYCRGRWQHGTVQGYTTFGLGTTEVPVRFLCPPEAAVIVLRKGPPAT